MYMRFRGDGIGHKGCLEAAAGALRRPIAEEVGEEGGSGAGGEDEDVTDTSSRPVALPAPDQLPDEQESDDEGDDDEEEQEEDGWEDDEDDEEAEDDDLDLGAEDGEDEIDRDWDNGYGDY